MNKYITTQIVELQNK